MNLLTVAINSLTGISVTGSLLATGLTSAAGLLTTVLGTVLGALAPTGLVGGLLAGL